MTERKKGITLPPTLAPRGLCRVQAAAYIGVSPSLFDRMIDDGMMPKAKKIWGRRVWDRVELDSAFSAIPSGDDLVPANNPWDEVA